jgi:hypothetical protein
MAKKLYCIEIQREMEELMVEHNTWDTEPTRAEVLEYVNSLDCGYNDDYGKIYWYPVVESYNEEVSAQEVVDDQMVYIVIDNDCQKYEDIVIGVYKSSDTAEAVKTMYEGMTAVIDPSRFKVVKERVMKKQ